MKRCWMTAAVLGCVALSGCTSYYAISDPSTGKTYYTTKHQTKHGSLQFRDAGTGQRVTIQNSEVAKITKDQYRAATR